MGPIGSQLSYVPSFNRSSGNRISNIPLLPIEGIMATFTSAERRFLEKNEIARLATSSLDGMPHVVPVSYVFRDSVFLIAVDYGTKKYRNLLRNPKVALVVDRIRPNRGVMVQGHAKVFEKGSKFRNAYDIFHREFSWVRANPWKEGEAPFIKIEPSAKASWGFR